MTETVQTQFLDVGDGHRMAYQVSGPEDGVPFLFLHGGPGSGFRPHYRSFFDGKPVRLVVFDQRGCGQSTPSGIGPANTTEHLLQDIEALRRELGITQWLVGGHSWGTTLALLYALRYPERCRHLVLASLFLARKQDQAWSFNGVRQFLPDVMAAVESDFPAPCEESLYAALTSNDADRRRVAAYRFGQLGANLARMAPAYPEHDAITDEDVSRATILLHYAREDFYIPENYILEKTAALTMPVSLVHGRFDLDCLLSQAVLLQEKLPQMDLRIVQGGHSLSETAMAEGYQQLVTDVVQLCID